MCWDSGWPLLAHSDHQLLLREGSLEKMGPEGPHFLGRGLLGRHSYRLTHSARPLLIFLIYFFLPCLVKTTYNKYMNKAGLLNSVKNGSEEDIQLQAGGYSFNFFLYARFLFVCSIVD
jgi:hypothetical protein